MPQAHRNGTLERERERKRNPREKEKEREAEVRPTSRSMKTEVSMLPFYRATSHTLTLVASLKEPLSRHAARMRPHSEKEKGRKGHSRLPLRSLSLFLSLCVLLSSLHLYCLTVSECPSLTPFLLTYVTMFEMSVSTAVYLAVRFIRSLLSLSSACARPLFPPPPEP